MTWGIIDSDHQTMTEDELVASCRRVEAIHDTEGAAQTDMELQHLRIQLFLKRLGWAKYLCAFNHNEDRGRAFYWDPRRHPGRAMRLHEVVYRFGVWRKP